MNIEASYATVPPASAPRRRPGRAAMFLLMVITGLLLALGVIGWWRLAGINARYSRVVTETAASLNELHEIGLHTFAGYGNIIELQHARDSATRAALRRTIAEERAANDRLFESLKLTLTDPELRACLEDVVAKRTVCRREADVFMTEVPNATPATPATPDAEASLKLLHSYLAYQQACDHLTDRIETASLQVSRALTGEIRNLRWLFLGVGILPIVCAALFLVLILSLLKVMKIHGEED